MRRIAKTVNVALGSDFSRAQRSTTWWCAADPGSFQAPEFGTVLAQQRVEDARKRADDRDKCGTVAD
jgi:hypothetical protein